MRNPVRSKLAGAVAGTALLAGGIAAAGGGSAHAQSAHSQSAQPPVSHIVVLYLENHSFDNVLGYWQGPRVPLVIVSPYARPHFTDTTPTTFAGILSYAEHIFHLAPVGVNDARAYDFSRAFNYAQAPLRPARMVWRHLPASALHVPLRYLADDPTGT